MTQDGAYDVFALPPAEQEGWSRFYRKTSPGGWPTRPDVNAARCFLTAAAALAARAEPMPPSERTVALKRVGRTTDGEHVLVNRGEVTRAPTIQPAVPARIAKLREGERAGAFLDSFLLREPDGVFERATDRQVSTALLEWATETRASAEACRVASDAIALAVLVRHGIVVHPVELPS